MYTLVVVDDEAPALQLVEWFVKSIPEITFVRGFTSPMTAMDYLKEHPVDILVLDIEMTGMNGLELARFQQGKIIFSTAHQHFAVEGFNLSATDYLLKPYSLERFTEAIHKATRLIRLEEQQKASLQTITIKVQYSNHTIAVRDILYIESLNNNVVLHLESGKTLSFRHTLRAMSEELPSNAFIRIHRSYLVAVDKITAFRKLLVIVGNEELPVSPSYKNRLINRMAQ